MGNFEYIQNCFMTIDRVSMATEEKHRHIYRVSMATEEIHRLSYVGQAIFPGCAVLSDLCCHVTRLTVTTERRCWPRTSVGKLYEGCRRVSKVSGLSVCLIYGCCCKIMRMINLTYVGKSVTVISIVY